MNNMLLANSHGEYTLKQIVDLLASNGKCVENYNILVWSTSHGEIPINVVRHSHIIILNGMLVKDTPGVHFQ